MVKQPEVFSENTKGFSVKHTMHFYVDGEPLDLELHYIKETGEDFPSEIQINRTVFTLKRQSFVSHSDRYIHYHAYYEQTLN